MCLASYSFRSDAATVLTHSRNQAAAAEKLLAAEQIIFDDPFVQSMMQDFGAKIVPGSIKPL